MLPLPRLAGTAAFIAALSCAQAAEYPVRPIRFIVPSTPGGPTDLQTRLVADQLTLMLGKQVIVDNRAGAGGRIGLEAAAKASPDGHTIFFGSQGNLTVNPFIHRNLPYDPQKDFAPIVLLTRARYLLLASPSVPASNPKEVMALLKARPGQLNFASVGTGSTSHIAGELLKKTLKVDLAHVPYKGAASAMTDMVAGQVHFMFATPVASAPYVSNGRLKAIAIAAPQRSALFPAVPTFGESGIPGLEVSTWYGILTQAAVSHAIVMRLNEAINAILRMDEIRAKFAVLDAEPAGGTVAEFAAFIKAERAKWGGIVKEAGIRSE
jgi:tripartite-type tricarboxylate transporter receptor subunit TctC